MAENRGAPPTASLTDLGGRILGVIHGCGFGGDQAVKAACLIEQLMLSREAMNVGVVMAVESGEESERLAIADWLAASTAIPADAAHSLADRIRRGEHR
jgi:hypothetical protein